MHDAAAEKPCPRLEGRAQRGQVWAQQQQRHKQAVSMLRREDVAWLCWGAVDGKAAAGKPRRSRGGRAPRGQAWTQWMATRAASNEGRRRGQLRCRKRRTGTYAQNTK